MSADDEQPISRRASVVALSVFALLAVLVQLCLEPPSVRPTDSPETAFSAARAREVMTRLLADGAPHAAGTAAGRRTMSRLQTELEALGLVPEVQTGAACSREGVCAELHNVIARLPGTEPGYPIVLAAHHDSVPVGPGAGDDGQGVATVLEIARALLVQRPPRGALLLFTDGEELGMLGARLFAAEHPLAREAKVVLNLEARGNRGPSLMFETTPGSAWLVERFSDSPRPVATSLFGVVYRTLPNDTDLTIFAAHGWQGLNFAFVGGVENYHTPLDTLDRLDLRSVQQQGDSALATAKALLAAKVEPPGWEAIYFDLFSRYLVRVPAPLALPILPFPLLVFGFFILRRVRRGGGRAASRASLALLTALVLPALAATLLGTVLDMLGALPFPVVDEPRPLLLALAGLVLSGQVLAARIAKAHAHPLATWDTLFGLWALLGLIVAIAMPPASYIATLPALVAALVRLWIAKRRGAPNVVSVAMLIGAACAGLMWLPPLLLLPDTIGISAPAALALPLAFGLSPLLPFVGALARGGRTWLLIAGASLGIGMSQLLCAPFSEEAPRRLALLLEVDPTGDARWLADAGKGPLPKRLLDAAAWSPRALHPHPWPTYGQHSTYSAGAPKQALVVPEPRWIRTSSSSAQLELDAPAALWALGVRFPPGPRVSEARWRGRAAPPRQDSRGSRLLLVPGQERHMVLDVTFDGTPPATLPLVSIALGLPSSAAPLLEARSPDAVSSGFGDLTVAHFEARALD